MPVSEFFKKIKQNPLISINFKFVNTFLFILIGAGLVYYVAGVNDLVVKGFLLQELKSSSVSLERENNNFNTYITSLKSYSSLSERVKKTDMIEIGRVDYIRKDSTVAVR
jgi:hypothetical protein